LVAKIGAVKDFAGNLCQTGTLIAMASRMRNVSVEAAHEGVNELCLVLLRRPAEGKSWPEARQIAGQALEHFVTHIKENVEDETIQKVRCSNA